MFGITSWKTSLAGAVPLIGAAAQAVAMFTGAQPMDTNVLFADFMAFSSGIGLMFAKDHNVSNAPAPTPAKAV